MAVQLNGQSEMKATRDKVWQALTDPQVLKSAIPNCDEFTRLSDTEYLARGTIGEGFFKVKISARIKLTDLDPPNGGTIKISATGGWNSRGEAAIKARLTEVNGVTTVVWDASGSATGMGASTVEDTLRKNGKAWADGFFKKVAETAARTIWAPKPPPAPPAKLAFAGPRL